MARPKKNVVKPTLQTKTYYVYNDCLRYLKARYGLSQSNEIKWWHWVIDSHEIHNGCFITFEDGDVEYIEDNAVKTIFQQFLDEFAENGVLELYVWW